MSPTQHGNSKISCCYLGFKPLSDSILSRVLGCIHFYELRKKLHAHFQNHTCTKFRQLQPEVRNMTLGNCSVEEFLACVKELVDVLFCRWTCFAQGTSWCSSWRLPQEFDSVINFIKSKFEPMAIVEPDALIRLGFHLQKYHKKLQSDAAIDLTHTAWSSPLGAGWYKTKLCVCYYCSSSLSLIRV